jgi:hypothetical protein
MPLTEKQINAIYKLTMPDQLEILHNCAENLGAMSIPEFADLMQLNRREAYRQAKNFKSINQFGVKILLLNWD